MNITDSNRERVLWVGGLPNPEGDPQYSVLRGELRDILGVSSTVEIDIRKPRNPKNSGYAFVGLSNKKEVVTIAAKLNGTKHVLLKNQCKIHARPAEDRRKAGTVTPSPAPTPVPAPAPPVPKVAPRSVFLGPASMNASAMQIHAETFQVAVNCNAAGDKIKLLIICSAPVEVTTTTGEVVVKSQYEIEYTLPEGQFRGVFRLKMLSDVSRAKLDIVESALTCKCSVLIGRTDLLQREMKTCRR